MLRHSPKWPTKKTVSLFLNANIQKSEGNIYKLITKKVTFWF